MSVYTGSTLRFVVLTPVLFKWELRKKNKGLRKIYTQNFQLFWLQSFIGYL